MCLLPPLTIFELVARSHGWVVGASLMLAGYVIAALASARAPSSWSPAVGGSALVLGMSTVVGLQPTLEALSTRMELALDGRWGGPLALLPGLQSGDIGPWLLPLTMVVSWCCCRRSPSTAPGSLSTGTTRQGRSSPPFGLLPMLYGAGFWASMTVLAVVAATLLCAARLWRHDSLLVFGLSLLAVILICACYDRLADPLAWTLIGVACLARAVAERRPAVRAGSSRRLACSPLLAAAQWLTFAQTPIQIHGVAIVAIGSLGLLASQMVRETVPAAVISTRVVSEWLSVTWVVVGLAMAGSSPWHRAVELTVAGVAAGITAYLSQDRRIAGQD